MRRIHRYSSPAILLLAALVLVAVPQSIFAQDKAAKINEVMVRAHSNKQFNGAVLVAENGKVIYKKGFGLANMEWNIPNEPDTKFRLGSITKQFTAMLILQLVEQGKIKLEGKITDYLPEYRKDIGEKVTIHHLLTHTSGIPSYTGLPRFFEDVSRNPFKVNEFVKKYASNDLEFAPGTKWNYNNSGYFLLGAIIEKVTGKSYEQALKENIFDPLGMKNTGYDHYNTIITKRASGYVKTPVGYQNAPYLDTSIPYAAGSLYSTVEDLYLWDQALYTDKLLPAKLKEVMFQPFLNNYAYGWVIAKASLGQTDETVPALLHGGGIHGFNTMLVRLPDKRGLIVLLDNTSQGRNLDNLYKTIINILYDKPYTLPKPSIAETLLTTIMTKGLDAAIKQYRDLKAIQANAYDFSEGELNTLGYQLLARNQMKEAIAIFKLNVEAYPQAFNTYDSLGEAYMKNGAKELAIQNYKKSLELNPQNTGATRMLRTLENSAVSTATKVDPKTYDAYVGEYEVPGLGVIIIKKEGDKLMGQPPGASAEELVPQGEDQFAVERVGAQATFARDEKGQVTQVKIRLGNGREIVGKKIK